MRCWNEVTSITLPQAVIEFMHQAEILRETRQIHLENEALKVHQGQYFGQLRGLAWLRQQLSTFGHRHRRVRVHRHYLPLKHRSPVHR